MKYKVICGGILKVNGELAKFDTVLDEIELDDAPMRVKDGYVKEYNPEADKKADVEKDIDEKDIDEKKDQDDLENAAKAPDAGDLLAKAKGKGAA